MKSIRLIFKTQLRYLQRLWRDSGICNHSFEAVKSENKNDWKVKFTSLIKILFPNPTIQHDIFYLILELT